MVQEQLFIESEESAIEALAQRIGGLKMLGCLMYPDLLSDDAHKLLLNKLNPKNRAVFSSLDSRLVKRIGVQFECHLYKHWCDDDEGYQHGQPAEPKDSDDEIAGRIEDATKVLAKALDIYTHRQQTKDLKVV